MTQAEYVSQHAAAAAKMVSSPEFKALLETAREENKFATMTAPDETSLIKLSGAAIGWAECLKWLKSAHVPAKKPEPRAPIVPYQDPAENLHPKIAENKPKP